MIELPRKKKKERLTEKRCLFIDENNIQCETIFFGTGKSRFCKLHREARFRKIIDKDKILAKKRDMVENTANVIIKHNNIVATEIKRNCDICGKEYGFILHPATYVVPRYCEEHRNAWKRKLYIQCK